MGVPTLRLRADYLAIVTIAASEMFRIIARSPSLDRWTGSSDGLTGFATTFYDLSPYDRQERYFFDLFIGSASAKWSALAPIVVPMFMLLGISPEMTTAAYRMGDSVTNIATPLMSYFPLILTFAQRWDPRFGLGSLMATMLPYAGAFLVAGLIMVAAWVTLDLPLGPGVGVYYEPPAPAVAAQEPAAGGLAGPHTPPQPAAVPSPTAPSR